MRYIKDQEDGDIWIPTWNFLCYKIIFNESILLSNLDRAFQKKSFVSAFRILFCFYSMIKNLLATRNFDLEKCLKMKEFRVNFCCCYILNFFKTKLTQYFERLLNIIGHNDYIFIFLFFLNLC